MDFDPTKPFIIGGLGALVALKGAPGTSAREKIFNVVCGALLAGFLAPMVAAYFGLKTAEMQAGCAFAVGLFGMNLVATATAWLKDLKLADVLPWINRK